LSETETLVTAPDLYMPLADFKSAHAQFITTNGLKRKGWNEDYYKTAFEEWNITIEENTRRVWNGEEIVKNWVVGVGLRPVNSGGGVAAAAGDEEAPAEYRDDYDIGPDL